MIFREAFKKEFKIIPEAKLVQGKAVRKHISDNIENLPYEEAFIIRVVDRFGDVKPNIVTANAYCDGNDTWDENTGVMVCAAKLDLRNHVKMVKDCERAIEILSKCIRHLEKMCQKHRRKAIAIEEDLVNTYGRLQV